MNSAPLKILLVDDDLPLLRAMARQLQGHSLRFACDTESALQELQQEPVDVVVSDYSMPGGDGVALLEAVRRFFPNTRRMLMSSDPPPYLAQLLLSGVIERFVHKPLRASGIRRELHELVYGVRTLEPRLEQPVAVHELN